ncbi:MAG: enoyl-CoA hydratase/isomerase family protein [Dehalococcoidia bacterium]
MTTEQVPGTEPFHDLTYEVRNRVALITLNRPERLNALSYRLREEIGGAMRKADADPEVGCIVVTGAGRAFSAGGDLREQPIATQDVLHGREVEKVVIAAVNGLCYGAALMWAITVDMIVASEEARFCFMETRFGVSAGPNIPFLVGPQWAKMLVLAGEEVSARTARRIGLITDVVPHEELLPRTLDLANRVASMPRSFVRVSKSEIDGTIDMMGWAANQALSRRMRPLRRGTPDDAFGPDGRTLTQIREQDGMQAFIEARDAAWKERWTRDD